jgi:hypothetical protein
MCSTTSLVRKRLRRIVVAAMLVATPSSMSAAAADAARAQVLTGQITMTSEPGEWVGQGRSYTFPASAIEVRPPETGAVELRADFDGYWHFRFSAPSDEVLEERVYRDPQRSPDRLYPGLDVGGAGHGCNKVAGTFTVIDLERAPSGAVRSFHATFEQRCDGLAAALRGEIDFAIEATARPIPARSADEDVVTTETAAGESRSFVSSEAAWSLVVVFALAGVVAWTLLGAAWIRSRRRRGASP